MRANYLRQCIAMAVYVTTYVRRRDCCVHKCSWNLCECDSTLSGIDRPLDRIGLDMFMVMGNSSKVIGEEGATTLKMNVPTSDKQTGKTFFSP